MSKRLHFISGLPRSGSTLLSAILTQNPHFHAGMSSPLAGIYKSLEESMSGRNEFAGGITDEQRRYVLKGLFENFYSSIPDTDTIFDTNRMWCTKLPALSQLFPDAKIICCVRSISWIMDSIERLTRKNAFQPSGIFGFDAGGTVYTRINHLASASGLVGYSLDALKEAYFSSNSDKLILIEYKALCQQPHQTIEKIYDFIGAAYFEHDFENIVYSADEFDLKMGTPGLHMVRSKVEWKQRATILPPDLFNRFQNDMFWRHSIVSK